MILRSTYLSLMSLHVLIEQIRSMLLQVHMMVLLNFIQAVLYFWVVCRGLQYAYAFTSRIKNPNHIDIKIKHQFKASTTEHANVQGNEDSALFSWSRQWYPVAVEDQLDVFQPSSVTVLGKRLVIWKSKGLWVANDEVFILHYALHLIFIRGIKSR